MLPLIVRYLLKYLKKKIFQKTLFTSKKIVPTRGPNRPRKVGLACPRQAVDPLSLPVPVMHFPRPGLPACRFLRPACACLSWPVYCFTCEYRDNISVKSEDCLDKKKQENHKNQNQVTIIGVLKGGDWTKCS